MTDATLPTCNRTASKSRLLKIRAALNVIVADSQNGVDYRLPSRSLDRDKGSSLVSRRISTPLRPSQKPDQNLRSLKLHSLCPPASMEPTLTSGSTDQTSFVRRKAKGNVRKRTLDETEEPADPQAAIAAALAASGRRSKAIKGGTAISTKKDDEEKLQTFRYASSNVLQQQSDQGATAVLQTETQHDRDAR